MTTSTYPSRRQGGGPIERLLIVHLTLPEICTGRSLSEDAAQEELLEPILYYCNSAATPQKSSDNNKLPSSPKNRTQQQEAIQFAGLCAALYRLPQSIDVPQTSLDDVTSVVHLQRSALVFVPLEDNNMILAVAQICTASSSEARATPSAIRYAVSRAHQHFCLFRGGGIHRRLQQQQSIDSEPSSQPPCFYPGMDELYSLRKRLRRLSETTTRKECDEIQFSIEYLQRMLPITALRTELKIHYNDFCDELRSRSLECMGACRNVVEGIPPPIALSNGEHLTLYGASPRRLCEGAVEQLTAALETLFCKDKRAGSMDGLLREPTLLGVTVFVGGQLLIPTRTLNNQHTISNETATMLTGYMAHFQFQMLRQRDSAVVSSGGSLTPPRKSPLRPFALSFAADDMDDPLPSHFTASEGGFLAPPPLSFLSALDESNALECSRGFVWAPPVSLPVRIDSEMTHMDARTCLFSRGDFSYLLFLTRADPEEPTSYQAVFQDVEEQLAATLDIFAPLPDQASSGSDGFNEVKHMATKLWEVRGQEVIAIDRGDQTLTLFGDPRFDETKRDHRTRLSKSATPFKSPNATDTLDCRYRLASQLSLDSLLAFDDAMDEVQRYKRVEAEVTKPFEMCTLLSNRWVYAFAYGEKELYALFDSAYVVTVADVQHAARQIRTELLGTIAEN